jgi:hypothetical protein
MAFGPHVDDDAPVAGTGFAQAHGPAGRIGGFSGRGGHRLVEHVVHGIRIRMWVNCD